MKKNKGPLQRTVEVKLSLRGWIPERVTLEHLHPRLLGYSMASASSIAIGSPWPQHGEHSW